MIIVAGEALIDLILQPDGRLEAVPGGGPYNTARTIGRLGGEVAFLGRLSSDRFGERLQRGLADDGVGLDHALICDAPTTLAVAELDGADAASYRFYLSGTSAPGLQLDQVQAAFRSRPEAVHIGTLGLVAEPIASNLAEAVGALHPSIMLMVDPNCRPAAIPDRDAYRQRLRAVLSRADVVKVSLDDLAYLEPGTAAETGARRLLDLGSKVVLLTDGARIVHVIAADYTFAVSVPAVQVVDTIGAGDAFGGAFIAWLIECGAGRQGLRDAGVVREAVQRAVEVASLTCQRAGADPPRRGEVGWPAG